MRITIESAADTTSASVAIQPSAGEQVNFAQAAVLMLGGLEGYLNSMASEAGMDLPETMHAAFAILRDALDIEKVSVESFAIGNPGGTDE